MTQPTSLSSRRLVLAVAAFGIVAVAVVVRVRHDHATPARPSITEVERKVRLHPDDEQAQLDWGAALVAQQRLPDAQSAFETAARLAPSDARPLKWLGTLALKANNPASAIDYFHRSLQRDPSDADIWNAAGTVFLRIGKPTAASNAFTEATKRRPNDTSAWLGLGEAERACKHEAIALTDLQHALTLDPANFRAQLITANTALETGNLTVSSAAAAKALSLKPSDPDALLTSARITLLMDPTSEGLSRAAGQIDASIAAHPRAEAYVVRGQLDLSQRQYTTAVADLKHALATDAGQLKAHTYLSKAYAALRQPDLARKETDEYTRLSSKAPRQETLSNKGQANR